MNPWLGYDVRVNSYCDVENSILFNHVNVGRIRVFATPSSTAT